MFMLTVIISHTTFYSILNSIIVLYFSNVFLLHLDIFLWNVLSVNSNTYAHKCRAVPPKLSLAFKFEPYSNSSSISSCLSSLLFFCGIRQAIIIGVTPATEILTFTPPSIIMLASLNVCVVIASSNISLSIFFFFNS